MVDQRQVMSFRIHAQQLDRVKGTVAGTAALDIGVQDTGPDGGMWALAARGVDVKALPGKDLILLWTVRGAPHFYRRAEAGRVAAAVEPFSDGDAGKRIFDASRPLKQAGIANLDALDEVAEQMRAIVTKPTVKGEVSGRLAKVMPEPYLRFCRACNAIHLYEQTFRLAAVRAGLELRPGTSPPVLERISRFSKAGGAGERLDPIRAYLRLLGPATHKHVADYLDAPLKDVKAHWPEDTVVVLVGSQKRWVLAGDEQALESADAQTTRLLGPFDLFLQARDRETIVPDSARAKQLWPVLGRPGAVLAGAELVGAWRPRKSGSRFTVSVQPWRKLATAQRRDITEQAERLAAFRDVTLKAVDFEP
jgi:Winged helix DNA-binding domain